MVDAAVVIVTHDTRDEVLGCLASLDGAAVREVVVVDSGSRDGTAAAVRAAFPDVRVVELVNVGFGRGANAGLRATTAPVVVVANADVRFAPGAVEVLAAAFVREPAVGVLGPAVVYPDGRPQASARSFLDPHTALGHALLGRLRPENPWTRRYHQRDTSAGRARDVDWVSGCAMAVRREAFDAVGGFDPGYFLYVEDAELCERMGAAGWRVRYDPRARVTHRVGASTGTRRLRSLTAHARSWDRYLRRRMGDGVGARLLRPLVRVGLGLWVVVSWVTERASRGTRSTTGERTAWRAPTAGPIAHTGVQDSRSVGDRSAHARPGGAP